MSIEVKSYGFVEKPEYMKVAPNVVVDVTLSKEIRFKVTLFLSNITDNPIYVEVRPISQSYQVENSTSYKLGKIDAQQSKIASFEVERTELPSSTPLCEEVDLEIRAYRDESYSNLIGSAAVAIPVCYVDRPENAIVFDFSSQDQIAGGNAKVSDKYFVSPPYAACGSLEIPPTSHRSLSSTVACVKLSNITESKYVVSMYIIIPKMCESGENWFGCIDGIKVYVKDSSGNRIDYLDVPSKYIYESHWFAIALVAELNNDYEVCLEVYGNGANGGFGTVGIPICVDDVAVWEAPSQVLTPQT